MSNQTVQAAKSAADSANALATQAVSAASDAKTALATANSALETATDQKTTVATLVTKTDDLAGTIATLATKTDINKLSGEVTAAQTLAQQTADGLQLKADQSVVNTINGSVNQLRADLKVANDRLSLTMTKNDVTGLLTPYATQSWTQGQITATASQFNAQFSSISGKVDALKFGNRNLLLNTSNMINLAHWTRTSWGSATTIVKLSTHPFYHNGRDNLIKLTTTDSWDGHLRSDVVAVKPDTDYNFQFLGFHNYNVKSITVYFLGRTDATSPGDAGDNYDRDKIHLLMNAITLSTSGTKRATATFHTNPGETLGYVRFDMNGGYNATDPADMYMVEAELAEGPTVPVYSPAPEDSADYADAKVASLKVTVDGIQSTVANYQGQTTTALQTLQGFQTTATDRINGLKLQQTQLASQWTSVVSGLSNPNLILNSMYPEDVSKLGWIDTGYLNITSHAFYAGGGQTLFSIKSTDARERTVSTNRFKVTRNTAYTVSLKAFANWNTVGLDIFVMMRRRGSAKYYDTFQLLINNQKLSPSETLSYSAIFNSGDYDEAFIRIDNNGMVDTSGDAAYLFFAEPKVELGSMATPDVQSGTDSQITQLQDAINLRVSKNDVLSQINLEANRTLIQSGKLVLDAPTVVFTGNAFIPSAAIASLSADKITTGTLNAANLNVINLNASAIVTGTISGANLAINLNTGEVLFQKGSIKSTNGLLNINIDNGTFAQGDGVKGMLFTQGELYLSTSSMWASLMGGGDGAVPDYGKIGFNQAIVGQGLLIEGKHVLTLGIHKDNWPSTVIAAPPSLMMSDTGWFYLNGRGTLVQIDGGDEYEVNGFSSQPAIYLGTNIPTNNQGPQTRIVINAEYVHIRPVYEKTTSSSPNVFVASDGALVRSTSASKYKTNIKRDRSTELAERLLTLPTAHWLDKAAMQRFAAGEQTERPQSNFGLIAEDLAAVGLEDLVVRGVDGELEGIQYDRIAAALLPLLAQMKNEIDELKATA
ncbi:hypothetical protein LCAUCD174_2016 [Lacticaseibacillus paracasei]|nr:hypothetical protein LCAUCD174_2016 [Lacticaseibacillus paracasei]